MITKNTQRICMPGSNINLFLNIKFYKIDTTKIDFGDHVNPFCPNRSKMTNSTN